MKSYKLKLTALTPIHIGTGEDFEPTNYVIDLDEEKKPKLFEFCEFDFFRSLDAAKKKEFESIVSNPHYTTRFKLYDFIYKNRVAAKKIAFKTIPVSKDVFEEYVKKIGQVAQKEGGGKNVFNEFKIAKTYTDANRHYPILPGSSLKGSISTAYQESLFKKLGDYRKVEELMLKPHDSNLFKNLLLSDAVATKQGMLIGDAVNKKRNKETKGDGLPIRLQAISPASEFVMSMTCKEPLVFEEIARSCNEHYMPIFKSQFNHSTDEYTRSAISSSFVQKYENWDLGQNQFLLRVGKHSGARAVTVDGVRNIKIMMGRNNPPKFLDHETTVWLRSGANKELLPFGWALCEVIGQ